MGEVKKKMKRIFNYVLKIEEKQKLAIIRKKNVTRQTFAVDAREARPTKRRKKN